ncbi:MAG TPA: 4Fe-4S dicluster domain-containing protein [Anaerolineales bacterium]|nr:4Fe-4S dicluster domain-containing protein [Anaerolineales bacterium]
MTVRVNPQFLTELKKYGAVNVEKCFNCGNCTAICPLSTSNESFPRRMIRYAQLGLKEKLLGNRELWLCYYCGECTQTCPQQADPGEFMAAARRYAIASYDPLGLAKLLYTAPIPSILVLVLLAVVIGLGVYSVHGPMPSDTLKFFDFIPSSVIHTVGVTGMIVVGLLILMGMANMIAKVRSEDAKGIRTNWLNALWEAIVVEALTQRRFQRECETASDQKVWYRQKWFVHASTLWGFLGLLLATALDYGLEMVGVKATGTWVPLWYPVRLLGTIAGLFLVYGTSMAFLRRIRKTDEATTYSTSSDWAFLSLLWLTGMSGFILEIAEYLPSPAPWVYWTLLCHISVAGELLLLLPFTKFAHAIYRTIALYFHALKPAPVVQAIKAGTDG